MIDDTVPRSAALYERACRVLPGGVNSPVRSFSAVGGTPRFIDHAAGPYIWDVDGKRYVDYVMSWGPLIHGHAYEPVVRAVASAAQRGTSYGAPTEAEVRLAEMVVEAVPSVEMVRFVNSGTEATMSALRLARGWTGRDLILKFGGNYHGHVDALLAQAGSGSLTLGVPTSPGVPRRSAELTIVAPYNDVPAVEDAIARYGSALAAVVVEPIAGNMGVVAPAPGFLEAIRRGTQECDALFICDEVITGFRVAPGGAQSLLGLDPDITTLGKIIGGGLPVGAYGGRREIMERIAPRGPVYQAGTLSGNPLAIAAGMASLEGVRQAGFYQKLEETTRRLADGLRAAAQAAGIPLAVNLCTGMLTVFFRDGPVSTLHDVQGSDTQRYARFFHAMLGEGIYLPPSQFEAWMLSSAHSTALVDQTIEAAFAAFTTLQTG